VRNKGWGGERKRKGGGGRKWGGEREREKKRDICYG